MQEMPYVKRDVSWLAFNERVLQEAQDERVPLYERIKFLAIYSSNLDEFFEVLTLEQTQRIPRYPMILFGKDYWHGLLRWVKGTVEKGKFISPGDLELCTITDDPQEAVDVILDYMRRVGPPDTFPRTLA